MSNRATSAYSLRVHTPPSFGQHAALDGLRDSALLYVESITDLHYTTGYIAVGYRATGDETALALAAVIRDAFLTGRARAAGTDWPGTWELQTGYGIHRRTVTPEAATG